MCIAWALMEAIGQPYNPITHAVVIVHSSAVAEYCDGCTQEHIRAKGPRSVKVIKRTID